MKTFILKWRPSISNYSFSEFSSNLKNIDCLYFNWEVYEHDKVRPGDRFYMIVCGTRKEGVVMKGYFISGSYKDDDWSDRGREVYYAKMKVQVMVDPRKAPVLSVNELAEAMPDFDWEHCHCGCELPESYVDVLEAMWEEYFEEYEYVFDWKKANFTNYRQFTLEDTWLFANEAHEDQVDMYGNPVLRHVFAVGTVGLNREEKICGYLHEYLECDGCSVEDLMEMKCPERIVRVLELLKYDEKIPYMDYIKRICESGNKTAIAVKFNDLNDTVDLDKAAGNVEMMQLHSEALQMLANNYHRFDEEENLENNWISILLSSCSSYF